MTSGKYFAEAGDDEVVRLQKSHLGDKLTQDVKTSNIGYAAQEINQEVLKEIDLEMRNINKQLANLYKNKPAGYKEKMDILNQQGTDLAAVSKGYGQQVWAQNGRSGIGVRAAAIARRTGVLCGDELCDQHGLRQSTGHSSPNSRGVLGVFRQRPSRPGPASNLRCVPQHRQAGTARRGR